LKNRDNKTFEKRKKNEILISNIKKAIDEYNIISFDIFDTLLIRPYSKPTDLFMHIEKLNNATGFKDERMKAYKKSLKKNLKKKKEEVTIDDIYNIIPSRYKWLKKKEITLEYNVLRARPLLKEIYDYAYQKNKKIIIISDMYLSTDFLFNVLKKCGYKNFDKIFVSSKYKKTKRKGSLYKQALIELDASANDILHIGDNYFSDIKKARKLGINAFYIPKSIENLFIEDKRIETFYEKYKNDIGASIMLGVLAPHIETFYNNYWFEYGYKYVGPIIFGFMQWLNDELNNDNIKNALFIGRAGYTLEKVFNIIKTSDIQTYYIYLPRKIAVQCFKIKNKHSNKVKMQYLKYLKKFKLHEINNIAMIDELTTNWTAQKALYSLFPKKFIKGYYFFTIKNSTLNYKSFKKTLQKDDGIHVELTELFMTAPTPPIEAIRNGKPIFKKNINPNESIRIKLYPELSNGVLKFTEDFLIYFNKLKSYFTYEMLMDWLDIFSKTPSEIEKYMFYNIQVARDYNHDKFRRLFSKWYS